MAQILVVDDEVGIRELLSEILSDYLPSEEAEAVAREVGDELVEARNEALLRGFEQIGVAPPAQAESLPLSFREPLHNV